VLTERRERSHSIGLAEGDSMPEENILPHVKPIVLAKHHPAIIRVFPHVWSSVLANDGNWVGLYES
jgi:hypothetical protein